MAIFIKIFGTIVGSWLGIKLAGIAISWLKYWLNEAKPPRRRRLLMKREED